MSRWAGDYESAPDDEVSKRQHASLGTNLTPDIRYPSATGCLPQHFCQLRMEGDLVSAKPICQPTPWQVVAELALFIAYTNRK